MGRNTQYDTKCYVSKCVLFLSTCSWVKKTGNEFEVKGEPTWFWREIFTPDRELPVSQFSQGKACFLFREPLFSLQGAFFHYRDFPVNPCTFPVRDCSVESHWYFWGLVSTARDHCVMYLHKFKSFHNIYFAYCIDMQTN